MSNIKIQNLSLKFRSYKNNNPSIKEWFANLMSRKNKAHDDFWAIKNVSVEIKSGDRVGILGHNGAGKSTFLKTLCGIYQPTKGSIKVEGNIAPMLEIGAGFHPEFTGRENIYLNGAILGLKKSEIRKLEQEIIDFAEIEEFIDTPVKYYSTGMYMRLAFSLSTAIRPNILVLDEIFAGGDDSFLIKAKKRMHELIDQSDIMILVSHDSGLIESLCNRAILLDHGALVDDGSPREIVSKYLNKESALLS